MSWRDHLRPDIAQLAPFRPTELAWPDHVTRLDCNEAPFPIAAEELADFRDALVALSLQRYPEVDGASLRRALAERWCVDPAQILLGNGSAEVLSLLATAFGGGRRGRPAKLLYPDPSFPHYEIIARTHGLEPLPVALEADFGLDEGHFAQAIAEHAPALAMLASPNNPSGNAFDPQALMRLAQRMDAALVVDEAYIDFMEHGDAATLLHHVNDVPGLFVTRTLSKVGFAGLRVGALIGSRQAIAELDKVRLPWNLNAVSMAFAKLVLARPERLAARVRGVVELRHALEGALRALPKVHVFPSQANFVLVRVPAAPQVFSHLLEHGIVVRNFTHPRCLEDCLRITVGTSAENQRCVQAIAEVITGVGTGPDGR